MDYSNTYSFYEKKANSVHNRRCIDGKVTGCGNCVGYCRYEMHPGFLTTALRKEHNCIKKECYYYVDKPHKRKNKPVPEHRIQDILSSAQSYTTALDCIKFIRADIQSPNNYTLYYITITNNFSLSALKSKLQNEFVCNVDFVELPYSFDVCELIFLRT